MNIGIDISPLKQGNFIQHRVRGTGFYINNLKSSFLKYFPNNKYTFFIRCEKLSKNVDLVHYPYFEPFFLTLPFFSKYKTIVTVHDLTPLVFPKYFPRGVKGELKWQMQKMSLKKADAIITDSESSKKDIIKYAGAKPDKVNVVYLAAGDEFRKKNLSHGQIDLLRKKYRLPGKFVLYVGDVTWNKNLPRLIEACLKADIPLVLAGKALLSSDFDRRNPWNQDLVKVQELCIGKKNIIRIGFISDDDLVRLYNIATAFVMPSLYEGFGLPIPEAMSCGCPVISSKEGSIPEVAGDAAFYVDAYDIDSITGGIKEVFSSTDLQKELSEKGLIQSKKFSWKQTAEDTIKVYNEVLD